MDVTGFLILEEIEMEGWIKLHRKIADWDWWDKPDTLALWVHCLIMANNTDKNWRGITIKKGQFICSISNMVKSTGLSPREFRTSLERLKTTNEIAIKTTNKYTIITVCKYDSYQQNNLTSDTHNDTQNDKQPTSNRQATDKQPTTTKEYKESKEEKNLRKKNNYSMSEKNAHVLLMKIYCDWFYDYTETPAKITGADGKALHSISKYLKSAIQKKENVIPDESKIAEAFEFILKNIGKWEKFHQNQIKITQIDSNLPNIMNALRNGTNGKQISKFEELQNVCDEVLRSFENDKQTQLESWNQ